MRFARNTAELFHNVRPRDAPEGGTIHEKDLDELPDGQAVCHNDAHRSGAARSLRSGRRAAAYGLATRWRPSSKPHRCSSTVATALGSEPLIPDGTLTPDDPLPVGHTIHVVTHDNQDSWKVHVSSGTVTFENDECDPDATPLPSGALHLVVAPGIGPLTYARLRATRYHRTYLRDLTRLDYWACDHKNNGQQWPFVVLEIDQDGDNVIDDEIVFEPAYQNASEGGMCGAVSDQGPEMLDAWQFWDGLRTDAATGDFRACWWSVEEMEAFPPGFTIRSLSEYIAVHPNAAIVNLDGNHGGVQVMHGFSDASDSYDGWVDAFTIGKDINGSSGQTQNSTVTYDFQKP